MANILQIAVPTGPAALCWPARSDPAVQSLLFINQDLTHIIYIGQISSITPNSPNTIPIPPNGTFSGDAATPWYVIGASSGILPVVMVPNGQAYFRGLTQAAGQLALPQFQSPNYVPGSAGWAVFQNGHAEFSDITVRGAVVAGGAITGASISASTITGGTITGGAISGGTITGAQEFLYSGGTPAVNTLIYSNSLSGNVQDSAGNWYLAGTVNYGPDVLSGSGYVAIQQLEGIFTIYQAATMTGGSVPWVSKGTIFWDSVSGFVLQQGSASILFNGNSVTIQVPAANTIKVNPQIEFIAQSGTPAATANAIGYADSLGALHVIDGTDGNKYATQRMTPVLFSDTASLTALTTVFSFAGGVRTYEMHGRFYCTPVLNAQLSMEVVAPAGATGQMSVEIKRATTWFGGVAGAVNAVNSILVNLPAASGYMIDFHCILHLTAAGTVNIQCGSATANALVINAFSALDIMPT